MKEGRDNYNRLYELLMLINALRNSRAGLTYEDIMDKLDTKCTRRTVERMLDMIENMYHSFERKRCKSDNKMYFRILPDSSLPPVGIHEAEVVALNTALGYIKNNEPLRQPLENLAGKLHALKSGGAAGNIEDLTLASGTASAPRPRIKCDNKVIRALQDAILTFTIVKIKYRKKESAAAKSYTVCPLGFLYGLQNNYLVACCADLDEHPRHYILSQIEGVTATKEGFKAPGFNIQEYAKKSFGSWIAPDGGYKVRWKVAPEAAERARRFEFHPTQLKPKEMADGSLIIEFFADGLKEMAWHLMTWEGQIKPLAPKELVDEYARQLKLAANALK